MGVKQKLFDAHLRYEFTFENIVNEFVNQVVGKFRTKLREIFSRVDHVVSDYWHVVLQMI
jgi:hypothetical protein